MRRGEGCEDTFCEEDPEQRVMDERFAYVGRGRGDYTQVTSMQPVGHGQGEFAKEKVVVRSGLRLRLFCVLSLCFMVLVVLGLLLFYLHDPGPNIGAAEMPCENVFTVESEGMAPLCCEQGFMQFCATTAAPQKEVVHEKYITRVKDVRVPHVVQIPIPGPPRKVITHKVYVHTHAFDCEKGYNDWHHLWSSAHQRYCCYLKDISCRNKVEVRKHYHIITKVRPVALPVRVPIPAPPPRVVRHVVNEPIQDPPQVIRVPTPGAPHIMKRIVHEQRLVPVPVASPPQYHTVPVPIHVTDPGRVIRVKVPMPPQTVVRDKTIYKTKHIQVKRVYDRNAGLKNWIYGWSGAKKHWCCANEDLGCPGTWHGTGLTKTVTTGITSHVLKHAYYTHLPDYGHGGYDDTHHYVYHHGYDVDHGSHNHAGVARDYEHGGYDGKQHYVYHHGYDVGRSSHSYHVGAAHDYRHGGPDGPHHYVYHHVIHPGSN